MSLITTIPVQVIGPNQEQGTGEVQIESWTKPERTRRALKWLALGWLISICIVPIPMAHIIGAIAFILTPFAAHRVYSTKTAIAGGTSTCPRCQAALPIAKGREFWPLTDLCTSCHSNVTIEKIG